MAASSHKADAMRLGKNTNVGVRSARRGSILTRMVNSLIVIVLQSVYFTTCHL